MFSMTTGTPLNPANVRRAFRRVVAAAGMDPMSWTPRELRHSFVSLLSSAGIPIEDIAHLVGHANTRYNGKGLSQGIAPRVKTRREGDG